MNQWFSRKHSIVNNEALPHHSHELIYLKMHVVQKLVVPSIIYILCSWPRALKSDDWFSSARAEQKKHAYSEQQLKRGFPANTSPAWQTPRTQNNPSADWLNAKNQLHFKFKERFYAHP